MIDIIRRGGDLSKILQRNQLNFDEVNATVKAVIKDVKENKDAALIRYAERFDSTILAPDGIRVTKREIEAAYREVPVKLLDSLKRAKENILRYHRSQIAADAMFHEAGRSVGWVLRPVSRAGVYVPGGTASYPSSVLMTVLPAVAAGVKEVVMTTPSREGRINPLTIVAAAECGVSEIYKVGGAQAVAALAFGTETVKRADVVAGPGNVYVTVAKKEVYGYVGVDMIAGPSEILILADGTACPKYLAADMLSQSEHDALATSILIVTSDALADAVAAELERQIPLLPREEIVRQAVRNNSAIVVVSSVEEAVELANRIAPEHLELCLEDAKERLKQIQNAGAVFLGNYSPEPLGDYFAGPNHVLPTSGTARFFSVLNTMTYMKRISVIQYDREALAGAREDIVAIAECEGLAAHANAVKIRFE